MLNNNIYPAGNVLGIEKFMEISKIKISLYSH